LCAVTGVDWDGAAAAAALDELHTSPTSVRPITR
jgi:hypothetical protein